MSRLQGWWEVLRSLLLRRRVEREMEDELRFHMESQVAENVGAGMTPAQARAEAAHAFGAADRFREETRDARGTRRIEDFVRDVGHGLRVLRRTPGLSLVAVLTLALGVGATVALFSVVKGVLLAPLPYPQADRLVSVWGRFLPESGFDFPRFVLSPPEYFDYRAQNHSLEDVAASQVSGATLVRDDGQPIRVHAALITANLFAVLRVSPELGRSFTVEEDAPGGAPVAILGNALWRAAFGADPTIIGRTVRINGKPWQVVGVMPAGFAFPDENVQLWATLGLDPAVRDNRSSHFLTAVGRLRPGGTLVSASREMSALMARWKIEYPNIHTGHFLYLSSLTDDVTGPVRPALFVLLGAVCILLLIGCANVASILLARGAARAREVAVRTALGAGRARLVQQFLTEGLLVALLGGALGLLFARAGLGAILASAGGSLPRAAGVRVDAGVVLFASAVSLLAALLSGSAPAWRASAVEPQRALRDGDRSSTQGGGRARLRSGLVVAQVALAMTLVSAAGLVLRSFLALAAVQPGFDVRGVVSLDLSLPRADYADSSRVVAFMDAMRERMRALPGVRAAGATSTLPLHGRPGNTDFDVEGRPPRAPGEPASSGDLIAISAGYLDAMHTRVVEGRAFTDADRQSAAPVALVNRTLARMFWPGQSPLGRRLRESGFDGGPWLTVVGVVDDVRYALLDADQRPAWYVPLAQSAGSLGYTPRGLTFVARTDGDAGALAPALRDIVRSLDAGMPVIGLQTMEDVMHGSLARPRFTLQLLEVFATLALLLGAIGLYGTLSCAVGERVRELGIRRALGARAGVIALLVLRHGLALTLAGIALGLSAALAGSGVLRNLLFEVSPLDPLTFAGVTGVMLLSALLACLVPLARALRLDPIRVLRSE